MKDYYGILGVPADAAGWQIHRAWRRQAFVWHPDRNLHRPEEAHRRFLELGEAYAVLRDPSARRLYDLARPEPRRREEAPQEAARPTSGAWMDLEASPASEGPVWQEAPAQSGQDVRPTLHEYRAMTRALARELAVSDRRGRVVDMVMLTATILCLGAAIVLTLLASLPSRHLGPPPPIWMLLVAWLGTAVFFAWFGALRERRAERYVPFAEQVLERTGHGWRGSKDPPEDEGA